VKDALWRAARGLARNITTHVTSANCNVHPIRGKIYGSRR
jgi:hypothetical protein